MILTPDNPTLEELATSLKDDRNVQAHVQEEDDEERLRVLIKHEEWRASNLHPSQYERITTALEKRPLIIREMEIRQKPREECEKDTDTDFVFMEIQLALPEEDTGLGEPETHETTRAHDG